MKKVMRRLFFLGLLSLSHSTFAYIQCEGLWGDNGFLLTFKQTAFHCKWEVWNEMFPQSQTVLINPNQVELFSVESKDAADGYNSRYNIAQITGQNNIAPQDMDGYMEVNITNLKDTGQIHNGHKVFYAAQNPTGNLTKLGVIFDAKMVTINGTVNGGYQAILNQPQRIDGFSWRNRQDEQYGLRVKATYILLDPSFQGAIDVPTSRYSMNAWLRSQGSTIQINTDSGRYQNLKINGFKLTVKPRFKTCGLVGEKIFRYRFQTLKKVN